MAEKTPMISSIARPKTERRAPKQVSSRYLSATTGKKEKSSSATARMVQRVPSPDQERIHSLFDLSTSMISGDTTLNDLPTVTPARSSSPISKRSEVKKEQRKPLKQKVPHALEQEWKHACDYNDYLISVYMSRKLQAESVKIKEAKMAELKSLSEMVQKQQAECLEIEKWLMKAETLEQILINEEKVNAMKPLREELKKNQDLIAKVDAIAEAALGSVTCKNFPLPPVNELQMALDEFSQELAHFTDNRPSLGGVGPAASQVEASLRELMEIKRANQLLLTRQKDFQKEAEKQMALMAQIFIFKEELEKFA